MKRNNQDNVQHLLSAVGQLFNLGLNPKVAKLYPKVQYPVRRGTQSLAPLIQWDHQDKWLVTLYPDYFNNNNKSKSDLTIELDMKKDENKFYFDHVIDGRVLFPAFGYLFLVWQEFARHLSTSWDQLPIILENMRFLKATTIKADTVLKFKLNMNMLNGDFQLYESEHLICTGRIRCPLPTDQFLPLQQKVLKEAENVDKLSYKMSSKVSS